MHIIIHAHRHTLSLSDTLQSALSFSKLGLGKLFVSPKKREHRDDLRHGTGDMPNSNELGRTGVITSLCSVESWRNEFLGGSRGRLDLHLVDLPLLLLELRLQGWIQEGRLILVMRRRRRVIRLSNSMMSGPRRTRNAGLRARQGRGIGSNRPIT